MQSTAPNRVNNSYKNLHGCLWHLKMSSHFKKLSTTIKLKKPSNGPAKSMWILDHGPLDFGQELCIMGGAFAAKA